MRSGDGRRGDNLGGNNVTNGRPHGIAPTPAGGYARPGNPGAPMPHRIAPCTLHPISCTLITITWSTAILYSGIHFLPVPTIGLASGSTATITGLTIM